MRPKKVEVLHCEFPLPFRCLFVLAVRAPNNGLEYHGEMPHASRDKALQDFRDSDTAVMIASLKCGGVGLNLTAASRVIYIDLWWNSSVEQQAFCRVFRIGQVSETYITRFVVKVRTPILQVCAMIDSLTDGGITGYRRRAHTELAKE